MVTLKAGFQAIFWIPDQVGDDISFRCNNNYMNNRYKNLIFTNHALERIKERRFLQQMVWETFNSPDSTYEGKRAGTTEYRKRHDSSTITVIATQNEKNEWVVLSCWIDPPLPGTKDYKEKQRYHTYQKAGFWGKVWLTIKGQFGL